MKPVNHPAWIVISITAPLTLLLLLFGNSFHTLFSELDTTQMILWISMVSTILLLMGVSTGYAYQCIKAHKTVYPLFGIGVSIIEIISLFGLIFSMSDLIPSNVGGWVVSSGDLIGYGFTFMMPGIIWGMMVLVISKEITLQSLKKHTGIAIGVPLCWYLFYAVVLPIIGDNPINTIGVIFPVILITLTSIFLFSVMKIVYGMIKNKKLTDTRVQWLLRVPSLLVLPLLGLYLNRTMPFPGDFSSPWFVALTVMSAALFLMPDFPKSWGRVVLFFLRSVSAVFYGYFFLVYLPFLPLSVIAIVALGMGFLMLSPLIATIFVTSQLYDSYVILKKEYSRGVVTLIFILGLSVYPSIVGVYIYNDQVNFNTLMNYIYAENGHSITLSESDLTRGLNSLELLKGIQKNGNSSTSKNYLPYISQWYNSWVFDNQTLSMRKIEKMNYLFTGNSENLKRRFVRRNIPRNSVEIVNVTFAPDTTQSDSIHHSTWVHIELKNEGGNNAEFKSMLSLPSDVFISDYYLDVLGTRKYGIMAERKTATWVYQTIAHVMQRDPGLLRYYKGNDKIDFRVSPFQENETRLTGFKIEHTGPVEIFINSQRFSYETEINEMESYTGQNGAVLSSNIINSLQDTILPVKYHMVIDNSQLALEKELEIVSVTKTTLQNHCSGDEATCDIYLMNYKGSRVEKANWEHTFMDSPKEGGMFADRIIKHILVEAAKVSRDTSHVILLITNSDTLVSISHDLGRFSSLNPAFPFVYRLNTSGELYEHSLDSIYSRGREIKQIDPQVLKIFNSENQSPYYTASKSNGAIIPNLIPDSGSGHSFDTTGVSVWLKGAQLALYDLKSTVYPAEAQNEWLQTVRGSIKSGILTHQTAYIVLENGAQEKALLKKQKEILSGNKNLNIGDEDQMSEPELWAVLLIGVMIVGWRNRRKVLATLY
ncbi:MAG: MSEP-CTERM sorting domain-containing protein [Fibrobacterales bacterium]